MLLKRLILSSSILLSIACSSAFGAVADCGLFASSVISEELRHKFQTAMDEAKLPLDEQKRYWPLLERYLKGDRGFVEWNRVERLSVGDKELIPYEQAKASLKNPNTNNLADVAVVKLNGGLGTGMGLDGPKSLLEVANGQSFMDIVIGQLQHAQQVSGSKVPLVLMNSFSTEADTKAALGKKSLAGQDIYHMNQGTFLRIKTAEKKGDETVKTNPEPLPAEMGEDRFNPPGHGDVYGTLRSSGIAAKLRAQGKRFVMITNIDNLGATPDPTIAAYMRENKIPFLMEVTPRSVNDVKGGTVSKYKAQDGTPTKQMKLIELANVAPEHQAEFQDLNLFKVFNTNNVWVDLEALEVVQQKGPIEMDLIVNTGKKAGPYTVDQLEQAMGSAISSFPGAVAMVVPRTRFRPAKSSNELFLLRSGLFKYENGEFSAATLEKDLPKIELGSEFKNIKDFETRVPSVPDIARLKSLRVEGNVFFEEGVVLEGDVVIKAGKEKVVIKKGTHLKSGEWKY